MRIPATVEEDEDHADVVLVGGVEELIESRKISLRILIPRDVVQEDAHAVEADALRVSELAIDGRKIEGVGLPHLQLVDRGRRNEVAPDEPAGFLRPRVRLLGCPALRGAGGGDEKEKEENDAFEVKHAHHVLELKRTLQESSTGILPVPSKATGETPVLQQRSSCFEENFRQG